MFSAVQVIHLLTLLTGRSGFSSSLTFVRLGTAADAFFSNNFDVGLYNLLTDLSPLDSSPEIANTVHPPNA